MDETLTMELTKINRDIINLLERLRPIKTEQAQTVYELLSVASDIINE